MFKLSFLIIQALAQMNTNPADGKLSLIYTALNENSCSHGYTK